MEKGKTIKQILSDDEIALSDLIGLILQRKMYILITAIFFFSVGILIAVTSPIEYVSTAVILSEAGGASNSSSTDALSGLAGLAGFSLPESQSTGGLRPDMYPEIVSSQPFLMDLMRERFFFQEKGKELSLQEYFSEERPSHIFSKVFYFFRGIPTRFFSLFERKKVWDIPKKVDGEIDQIDSGMVNNQIPKIITLNSTDRYVMSQLDPRINVEADNRFIRLRITMPEPYVSAELNTIVLNKIVEYVVSYKTDKQRENYKFVEERCLESEGNFKKAQLRLASFRDSNQKIISQAARAREEQLQAEFNLMFDIYKSLAKQLEQYRIDLKKETPLFTEFEPVVVPWDNSEPNVSRIIVMWIALGIVFGFVAVFFSILGSYFKE